MNILDIILPHAFSIFFTMFRLGTGRACDFRGGDWGLGLIHGDVVGLGLGTGELYMEMLCNEQTPI